ncbi:MAG: response regulator, partial [Candidatus Eiseniibacteriota bacterium]
MTRLPAILLVDDDEDHVLVARRAFSRAGLAVDVRVARAGDEALHLLGLSAGASEAAPPITVVLLDIGLPGMSGWDVLRHI